VSSNNLIQEAPVPTDVEIRLANVALGTNNHPRGQTPKLESVGSDPNERFFMLATFCFDLSRKLKYISYALREYYPFADEEFKEKILADERYINPKPTAISWKTMAERAEEVMIRLHGELLAQGYPAYPPEDGGTAQST
jgi:hypothetical protein